MQPSGKLWLTWIAHRFLLNLIGGGVAGAIMVSVTGGFRVLPVASVATGIATLNTGWDIYRRRTLGWPATRVRLNDTNLYQRVCVDGTGSMPLMVVLCLVNSLYLLVGAGLSFFLLALHIPIRSALLGGLGPFVVLSVFVSTRMIRDKHSFHRLTS